VKTHVNKVTLRYEMTGLHGSDIGNREQAKGHMDICAFRNAAVHHESCLTCHLCLVAAARSSYAFHEPTGCIRNFMSTLAS
jgi:hypothetical protein